MAENPDQRADGRVTTPLDQDHARMMAAPEDEGPRRAYFARFAASDLLLLLEGPASETIHPRTVSVEGEEVALAFDTALRLASFDARSSDFVSLPGRDLAAMLAGAGLGLGLNLGGEGAAMHLSASDLAWIAEQVPAMEASDIASARIGPPKGASEALLGALDARLATMAGLATAAHLVTVEEGEGAQRLLLVFEGTPPPFRAQVAGHVAEALKIAAIDTALDVSFGEPGAPILLAAVRHGLRFDLPMPEQPAAPGSDPEKPPRLH